MHQTLAGLGVPISGMSSASVVWHPAKRAAEAATTTDAAAVFFMTLI